MADTNDFTVRVKIIDQPGIERHNASVEKGYATGILDDDVSEWSFEDIAQAVGDELAEAEVIGYEVGRES